MSISKEKFACLLSQRLRGHAIFELYDWISRQKKKNVCGTVFACSYGVQVESFKQKKLSKISCHCPYTVSHTPRQSAGEKNSVPYSASHLRDAPCPSSLASLPHFSSSLPWLSTSDSCHCVVPHKEASAKIYTNINKRIFTRLHQQQAIHNPDETLLYHILVSP